MVRCARLGRLVIGRMKPVLWKNWYHEGVCHLPRSPEAWKGRVGRKRESGTDADVASS